MLYAFWVGLCTSLLVITADAFSKYWVHTSIPIMSSRYPVYPYGGIPVFENFMGIEFSITHLTNRGAAWGTFGGYQDMLVGMRVLLIIAMITYLLFFNKQKIWQLPLSLVIAGALGNVIDYFRYGHVIDMFNFNLWGYNFPVFNVADSAVCIGIFSMIVISTWQDLKCKECK